MTPAHAIAELAALGLPAERLKEAAAVIDAVIATAMVGEEERKAKDRARKAVKAAERKSEEGSGRDRNSAEVHGTARNDLEAKKLESAVDIITNTTKLDNTPSSQQQRSPRTSRGTRLPDDFQPHPNILELARNLGFTDAEYWDHFQRFCDYWRSLSGAKALKLDWNATWRNRVKDLADRLKKGFNGKPAQNSIHSRFDKMRASISERGRGDEGERDSREDPLGLPGLRQSA